MAKDEKKPAEAKQKSKPEKKPTCFIIMPITVPEWRLADYGGDVNHFKHILNHLFMPAIEAAAYKPIRPDAKGDENIPARIIKKLETADMVLCDMSTWNANVLFELGVRTALDNPACLVKDDLTKGMPFDTATINCATYRGMINSWDAGAMQDQISGVTQHLKDAAETNSGANSLWNYFGLSSPASAPKEGSLEEQIALLRREFEEYRDYVPGMRFGVKSISVVPEKTEVFKIEFTARMSEIVSELFMDNPYDLDTRPALGEVCIRTDYSLEHLNLRLLRKRLAKAGARTLILKYPGTMETIALS